MASDLVQRAREGDRDAFAELIEPYQRELQVHCYRMLGSLQDAEDALQEAMIAAWIGLSGFEGRSSIRTWLYRVVTNRCLNAMRASSRRAVGQGALPVAPPEPSQLGEVLWLQPYPDVWLENLPDEAPGPEAQYEAREAISLAFVLAVQLLPPSQRAALILRDVLGFRAREAAEMLSVTEDALNGALKRARSAMADAKQTDHQPPPAGSREEAELVSRFVAAFTAGDIDALIALMTDDIWVRMPPLPFEYFGKPAARRFFTAVEGHRRTLARMVPTRANGQPAWGEYVRDERSGALHLVGVLVAGIAGDRICELTHFETTVAPYLGLPRTLPA